ncbi:histidine kinase [Pseudonocardia sp.]|uniref:ATP-dependent DNA ligase n=1 Tax=Pseudonocardia sp. TaxID=60912 RepID=UPI003D136104
MGRADTGGMPDLVPPMQAATGDLPTGPGWAVEFAWDGLRAVAYARPGRVRLLTARDRSVTSAFPELHVLAGKAPRRGVILDGTVVALDDAGVPSRRLLMRRTATQRPSATLVADVPVGFFVSDLLWLDGEATTALPYRRRRELVDDLGLAEQPVVLSPSWPANDAGHVLATARRYGLDGVYAKRLDSAYQPGRRSRNWLRVPLRQSRQVVVGGWTPASPERPDTVAALLLGVPGPAGLRYVGRVGIGAGAPRAAVTALLPDLGTGEPAFAGEVPAGVARDARWAVPRLVGQVEFTEWTAGGRLRLPVWRGLVAPEDVEDGLWDDVFADDGHSDDGHWDDRRWDDGVAVEGHPVDLDGPGEPPAPAAAPPAPAPAAEPPAAAAPQVQARRLEQHFVYNSLNTIASLVRTDPGRARELLLGFADLTRAADRPTDDTITLRDELDSVRAYLQLEQARFGKRLTAAVSSAPGIDDVAVTPLEVLAQVRAVVQEVVEPRPEGGAVTVAAAADGEHCVVTITETATGRTWAVRPAAATLR